ncbi:MAG: ABC transporter substrate-binding protein [Deltaproteobacteria bacterium]|nr:ABC transporter substrate-binding protein [Deltaproteobacteria bacterium]
MRATVLLLLVVKSLALVEAAGGTQQAPNVFRIGVLVSGGSHSPALLKELEEVGYKQGKNILIEQRSADGKVDLLPNLAADLVRLKVAVIVAVGPTAIGHAVKATKRIPIVMVGGGDPVSRGFVQSLSAPGGNVTGLSSAAKGLGGKRLELLKEALPFVSRVALLNPRTRSRVSEDYPRVAMVLGLDFQTVDVDGSGGFDRVFAKITALRPDALITVRELSTIRHARQIADFALKKRLPSVYESEEFVRAGGLMSYGVNYMAQWRRAAVYVDKVLKGAKPATLPVEPPRFELVINLKTAKKLGVTIAPEILLEADEVIK